MDDHISFIQKVVQIIWNMPCVHREIPKGRICEILSGFVNVQNIVWQGPVCGVDIDGGKRRR